MSLLAIASVVLVFAFSQAAVRLQFSDPTGALNVDVTACGTSAVDAVLTVHLRIAPDAGWAAVGWNTLDAMEGSDICQAFVTLFTGSSIVIDRFAPTTALPPADASQDCLFTNRSAVNSSVEISFTRRVQTADAADIDISQASFLVWAFGSVSNGEIAYHGANSGTQAFDLSALGLLPCDNNTVSQPAAGAPPPSPPVHNTTNSSGTLQLSDTLRLQWQLASANRLSFTALVGGTGWCGVGWGTGATNDMADRDIVLFSYASGNGQLSDRHSTTTATPTVDKQESVTLVAAAEQGIGYSITFERDVDTKDLTEDVSLISPVYVIWACGPGTAANPSQHAITGSNTVLVDFLAGTSETVQANDRWERLRYVPFYGMLFLLLLLGAVSRCTPIRPVQHLLHSSSLHLGPESPAAWWATKLQPWAELTAAQWILVVGFCLGLVGWMVLSYFAYEGEEARVWRIFGASLLVCLPLIVLPVARYSPILWLLRTDYLRALPIHKILGILIAVLITVHAIGMLAVYRSQVFEWKRPEFGEINPVAGFVAWLIVILLQLPFTQLRRRYWEVFRVVHAVGGVLIIIFGCLHEPRLLWFLIGPLVLYLADMIMRWAKMAQQKMTVADVQHTPGATVVILRPARNFRLGFGPAAHVCVQFPALSGTQWHPFSPSCCEEDVVREGSLTLHIKDMGARTFTHRIYEQLVTGMPARVAGPYGRLSFPPDTAVQVFLIAGGIGITPMASILCHLLARAPGMGPRRVVLVWSLPTPALLPEFEPLLNRAVKENSFAFRPHVHVTRQASAAETGFPVLTGRPDYSSLFSQQEMTIIETPVSGARSGFDFCAVYVCGPDGMVASVQDAVHLHNRSGITPIMLLHKERFLL
eukprot:TRINITY_DN68_c0_g3_i1.p1 TRINITY_DN68_c0_g3~~TRINITY_DN68_c0_g3_i1.p1  ORF type:complete len:872 (-),score=98.92 TRINITY_DN68_c0_g3_i1:2-2617(-)